MSTESAEKSGLHSDPSFAETALKLGGKSDDEARRTGAIDKADDQVESLFAPRYQTINSPIHRAIWERTLPVELFASERTEPPPEVARRDDRIRSRSRATSERRHAARRASARSATPSLEDLAEVGYWGLLVEQEYGGSGTPFAASPRS